MALMVGGRIPEAGFLRLAQIIGDARRGLSGVLPMSRTTFYARVKTGEFPKPVKSGRLSLWRADDIRRLLDSIGGVR